MAEKELSRFKAQVGCEVAFKYDDVTNKVTRATCDCDASVRVTIDEGATHWEHTFSSGQGQSEDVTEDFSVTEDAGGNPSVYGAQMIAEVV